MRIYSPPLLNSPGNYFFENFIQNLFNLETGNPFKENTEQNFLDSRTYLLSYIFRESATDVHYREEMKSFCLGECEEYFIQSILAVGAGRRLRICLLYRKAE